MKVAWDPIYRHPLPKNHRFPMEKYELLPQQLIHEGIVEVRDFFSPGALSEQHITAVHYSSYWQRIKEHQLSAHEIRRTGFPFSQSLVERETRIAQGTLEAAVFALDQGVSFNIAGGTHHAGCDFGEGFCILNDLAIAAEFLVNTGKSRKILIIDLDVHQGNGTADIFKSRDQVVTFSMHGAHNFPLKKIPSNCDVALPDFTSDNIYLSKLDQYLWDFCHRVKADFIFYQAGVDVLATDALGRLSLSIEACKKRDQMVLDFAHRQSVPLTVVMGGGYSPDLKDILEAHTNTYRLAREMYF